MALLLALAVVSTVLMVQPGQLASAARASPAAAEVFWRAALPDSPMPDAIRELLHHPDTDVANGVDEYNDRDPTPPMNFNYDDYRALPRSEATTTSAPAPDLVYGPRVATSGAPAPDLVYGPAVATSGAPAPDLVYGPAVATSGAPAPDLVYGPAVVRNAASSDDSAAAPASSTLFFLEDAVRPGESLPFHSTDRAGATADGPPPLELYTVRSVRAVDGSSFVVCRRGAVKDGPGHVYGCRATGPARAYILTLQATDDATMTAAAVCRTHTSPRDPEHAALRLLDGSAAAVCHAVPDAQVLPAKTVMKNPAAN